MGEVCVLLRELASVGDGRGGLIEARVTFLGLDLVEGEEEEVSMKEATDFFSSATSAWKRADQDLKDEFCGKVEAFLRRFNETLKKKLEKEMKSKKEELEKVKKNPKKLKNAFKLPRVEREEEENLTRGETLQVGRLIGDLWRAGGEMEGLEEAAVFLCRLCWREKWKGADLLHLVYFLQPGEKRGHILPNRVQGLVLDSLMKNLKFVPLSSFPLEDISRLLSLSVAWKVKNVPFLRRVVKAIEEVERRRGRCLQGGEVEEVKEWGLGRRRYGAIQIVDFISRHRERQSEPESFLLEGRTEGGEGALVARHEAISSSSSPPLPYPVVYEEMKKRRKVREERMKGDGGEAHWEAKRDSFFKYLENEDTKKGILVKRWEGGESVFSLDKVLEVMEGTEIEGPAQFFGQNVL